MDELFKHVIQKMKQHFSLDMKVEPSEVFMKSKYLTTVV